MIPTLPSGTRIGVLRGGTSSEYGLSMASGGRVLESLRDDYNVSDILIDRNGGWFSYGIEKEPHALLNNFDVVINALHGGYGEDGRLQRFLDTHKVRYTGADALGAALSLKKHRSKSTFERWNIRTPRSLILDIVDPEKEAYTLFRTFTLPIVAKPIGEGSSHGVQVAMSFAQMVEVFESLKDQGDILIEEYIPGSIVTCAIIENFRGEKEYVLLPVEIRVGDAPLYEHDRRHEYEFLCPTYQPYFVKKEIQALAKEAFRALGLRHYAQADFVVMRNGKVYLLEVNALPSLTPDAPFSHALEAVGVDMNQFVRHVASLALH